MERGQYLTDECSRYFGECASIGIKKVEAVGKNWIVVEDVKTGEILLARGSDTIDNLECHKCTLCPKCNGNGIIKEGR